VTGPATPGPPAGAGRHAPARSPVSTYRVQFSPRFTFRDACDLVPYLADLGVTECYGSPILMAATASPHGYDICSHERLNPDLGSDEDYDALCAALSAHGMGQILDVVPNHMGADPVANAWWRDVLENGPSSPFAAFFDIDWSPVKDELEDKLLLPVLGDQYGLALERGELRLAIRSGAVVLQYWDREFPLNPRQTPRVFRPHVDRLIAELGEDHADARELLSILTALLNLPVYTERTQERIVERQREKEVARERLDRLLAGSDPVRGFVADCLTRINGTPGVPGSFGPLHELLEAQAYRLASWRTAFDEVNYRRFFDINELVALRMEEPRVFDLSHRLVLRLVAEGRVTGLRIDHPDGLFDPAEYFARLQDAAAAARAAARAEPDLGPDAGTGPGREGALYVLAEKILSPGEVLRADWRVHGTTGYGFLNQVNGLFVDGANADRLRRIWQRFTGGRDPFPGMAYDAKKLIMLTSMASELNMLAHALNLLSEASWRSRDFTLNSLRKALMETIACFPVYRTYVSGGGSVPADRAAVDKAIARARRRNPAMEPTIFDFLRDVLLPDDARGSASLPDGPARYAFAMKVQQYTGPVHAKGVEDTAFYRHAVLLSANEVGGEPDRLGTPVEEFHAVNQHRLTTWPLEMLATATHDTKRGEDARVRIDVISEMPETWRRAVSAWMRINAPARARVEGEPAPDRNDEYLFYQALLGVWPPEPVDAAVPDRAPAEIVARLSAYMTKATKEAKVHTSWINPAGAYDRAVTTFVERVLGGPTAPRFLGAFVPFARQAARAGMLNALAQVILKMASPGVPDLYQGSELWDLSLVDPDNRRPVDFGLRRHLLEDLLPFIIALERGDAGGLGPEIGDARQAVSLLLEAWPDARVKLFLTARGLRLRRAMPDLFLRGAYVPLAGDDLAGRHLVSFARVLGEEILLAAAPRFTSQLPDAPAFPLGMAVWKASRVLVPPAWRVDVFRHLLTGERIPVRETGGQRWVAVGELFRTLPVAWLRGV
jgi:(1->4)-alpha-D-glucan 1-alpha-D-glucosylmutase